jgi:hypothetical protein
LSVSPDRSAKKGYRLGVFRLSPTNTRDTGGNWWRRKMNMTDQIENTKQPENAGNPGDSASQGNKAYSQEELNRMFAERSSQAERSLLKKLGFEKVEDAESILRKARERDESEKTELQKAQEKAAQLEKERESWVSKQKETAAQYDVALKAAKLGIVDPDAAWKLLDKSALEYGADDKPNNTEPLLQALLKDKPYLAGGGSSAANPAKSGGTIDPIVTAARKAAGLDK